MRKCKRCGVEKSLDDFRFRKSVCTGLPYFEKICRACNYATDKRWQRDNLEQHRADYTRRSLKYRTGLTIKRRDEIFAEQGGKCAICHTVTPKGKWCVDHDHQTGRVRGILCDPCNMMIGFARECVPTLERAIIYVEANDALRE